MTHPTASADITALILAGGRGSRMGGVDKGLQNFQGTPLALHALMRLQQQTLLPADVMINANRNLGAYEAFGVPVWPDALADYAGPLAGFLTGLERCETPLLLTVPCDVPYFPLSLCERLAQALPGQDAATRCCRTRGQVDGTTRVRPQPCSACCAPSCWKAWCASPTVAAARSTPGRRSTGCGRRQSSPTGPDDAPHAFANANTLAELAPEADARPARGRSAGHAAAALCRVVPWLGRRACPAPVQAGLSKPSDKPR